MCVSMPCQHNLEACPQTRVYDNPVEHHRQFCHAMWCFVIRHGELRPVWMVSYLCVMRLQCTDGEIQLFAATYQDQQYDHLHSIAKSYISDKAVMLSVAEIIDNVENPQNSYPKVDASTQTVESDEELLKSHITNTDVTSTTTTENSTKYQKTDDPPDTIHEKIEIDGIEFEFFDDMNAAGMNDNEFIDMIQEGEDELKADKIDLDAVIYEHDDGDITTDNLLKFVKDSYDNDDGLNDTDILQRLTSLKYTECPYKCGLCEKSYTRQAYLNSHIAIMHDTDKPFYKCSYCDKQFDLQASLKKHFITHIEDKPFKCHSHCGMSFGSRQQLQRHILIYRGINSFACSVCGKGWATKAGLKGHMVVHSNERAHQCADCGSAFARKSQLTRHLLLHKNDRKYTCVTCGKSFLRANDLTRHSTVHDPERARPFSCQSCGKRFVKQAHLLRHQTVHYTDPLSAVYNDRRLTRINDPDFVISHHEAIG